MTVCYQFINWSVIFHTCDADFNAGTSAVFALAGVRADVAHPGLGEPEHVEPTLSLFHLHGFGLIQTGAIFDPAYLKGKKWELSFKGGETREMRRQQIVPHHSTSLAGRLQFRTKSPSMLRLNSTVTSFPFAAMSSKQYISG